MDPAENIIILAGLEGNEPAYLLNEMQQFIAPHTGLIKTLYWGIWSGTLAYMVFWHIARPLWQKGNTSSE